MSKSVLLALTLPLGFLACTAAGPEYMEIKYPIMTLGQGSVEFGSADWGGSVERTIMLANEGQMPMGVGNIYVGDMASGSPFTVAWFTRDIECPEGTDAGGEEASAKLDTGGSGGDSGGGGGGGGDDSGGGDSGGGGEEPELDGALFVLDPGCQIPLTVTFTPNAQGDAYDALVIESAGTTLSEKEEDEGQYLPDFLADPVHTRQVVYLHGQSDYEQGIVVIRPRSYDFGFVHPDAGSTETPARIEIANVGDGDVTINNAYLSGSCDAFDYTTHFEPGRVLEGDQATLVEVTYTPADTDGDRCQLIVETDDPAAAEVEVALSGNTGSDPENVPPTAYIRWPDNGYRYSTIRPLTLELNIFDQNQPATSLVCRVKSRLAEDASVANCAASDESGHVYVEIPAEDMTSGVDTLLVQVSDGSSTFAYASISVVVNSEYPADDDDGDGYGVASEPADCDDTNIYTYPGAAEVYDLEDNDCDGSFDEDTEGGDDDGDGVTEVDGDCNDDSEDVFPGAPERGDAMDNDCDGTVDENTNYYDDDGDGFTEINLDCDDNNPDRNPTASEVCDMLDNDCDGFTDDGCEAVDSDPIIVGDNIRMEQSACLEAEVVTMDVLVHDADGDTITYQWSADDGVFDNPAAPTVNYTAPEIAGDTAGNGKSFNIYAVVFDEDGHQDWAFGRLAVYDGETDLYEPFTKAIVQEKKGCSSTGSGSAGLVALAGAAFALAFRRRE